MCKSVPQIPAESTSTTTSSGPATGAGNSSTLTFPTPRASFRMASIFRTKHNTRYFGDRTLKMPIAFFRNLQNLDPREIEKWPYLGCATKTHEESPQYECRCKWRVRFCGLE